MLFSAWPTRGKPSRDASGYGGTWRNRRPISRPPEEGWLLQGGQVPQRTARDKLETSEQGVSGRAGQRPVLPSRPSAPPCRPARPLGGRIEGGRPESGGLRGTLAHRFRPAFPAGPTSAAGMGTPQGFDLIVSKPTCGARCQGVRWRRTSRSRLFVMVTA